MDFTLCKAGPDGLYSIQCIERSCTECGVVKLENMFSCANIDVESYSDGIKRQGYEYQVDEAIKKLLAFVDKYVSMSDLVTEACKKH